MRVRSEERGLVSLENIFDQFYHEEQLRTNQELEGNVESGKSSQSRDLKVRSEFARRGTEKVQKIEREWMVASDELIRQSLSLFHGIYHGRRMALGLQFT